MPSGSYPCWQPCPPDDEDDDGNNDNDADSIPAPSDDGEEVAQVDWLPLPRSASSADSRGPGVGHTKATLGLGALPAAGCGAVKGYQQGKKSACVMSIADSPSKDDDLTNSR
ncbi:hypothetical protein CSUB01_04160 [Colletotrichum sublineola]|uniref:Uncharacterized protein n=1 Tax=Colletotrichum sublineola TaxID=1173701 RepID=A0A066X744_COLSU|nr:hypothetical protein CSUB01_04160 [Colletotrichum sublineola]